MGLSRGVFKLESAVTPNWRRPPSLLVLNPCSLSHHSPLLLPHSDTDAKYDKEVVLRGEDIAPTVTWGTSPQVAKDTMPSELLAQMYMFLSI